MRASASVRLCGHNNDLTILSNLNTGDLDAASYQDAKDRSLIVFDRGDEVTVQAGEMGIRFLLVSGKPLEEPIAWHGPIVMNTEAELRQAFREIREGTFIK